MAEGFEIATAFVRVSPDTSDFAEELGDAVAGALRTLAGRITGNPAPEAESCCICGSPGIAYRNHEDKPFCDPCADGDRPRMIRMHEGEQHRTISPEWREIFPGLQAKVGNVQYLMTEHGNTPDVTVLYRITPKD